jgi:putative ABC transport system permease protein
MKWLLSPAILVTLSLVIANSISISVRERRMEIAVLKVLGFRPWQIVALVLGEAILIGGLSGLACTLTTYFVANLTGGIKFPVAFFPAFMIPAAAIWWGLAIGTGTALLGSVWPAMSAGGIRVAEVFSKVA